MKNQQKIKRLFYITLSSLEARMLNYFKKACLIALMSGSLLAVDFGVKGIQLQSAQAASGGLAGAADAAAAARAASNNQARSSSTRNSSNAVNEDHSLTQTVKTYGVEDSNIMATLTMTAVGLLASRLWSCKMTTDMMLAAAGGAIFIGGEALAFFKLKSAMKDMETQINRDKKGNINREQIAALERLKKSYEEAKKTANTKKMLQMAAAAAFAAAAVMAYSLATAETTALATCKAAAAAAASGCPGNATAGTTATLLGALEAGRLIPSPSAAAAAKDTTQQTGEKVSENAAKVSASTLAASYAATCSVSGGATCALATSCQTTGTALTPACVAITPTLKATTGFCPAVPGLTELFTPSPQYFVKNSRNPQLFIASLLLSQFSSEARADLFSPLGIASSAAIQYLLMTSKTLGATIDMYLLAPMNRAIIWGILGGLTYAASSATDDVISQINANISKIDMILNSMNSYTAGATSNQTGATGSNVTTAQTAKSALDLNSAKYEDTDLSTVGNGQLPCSTGGEVSKCQSFEDAASALPGNNMLDKNSQMQLSAILKTANGFNGTSKISKGSLESAAKMAANAVAYRAAAENAKKLAQERLKASGSKVDLDAESKKFSNAIDKAMRDGLKKSNATSASMFASMYGGSAPTSSNSNSSEKVADEKDDKSSNVAAIEPGVIDPNAGAGTMAVDLGAKVEDAKKEMTAEELAAYNASTKGATNIDDFEIKNDITKDTSSSLFELISNRYQRSGYQRLFKVKEAQITPVSN